MATLFGTRKKRNPWDLPERPAHWTPGIGDGRLASEEQSSFAPALPDFPLGDQRHQLPDSSSQPRAPGEGMQQLSPGLAALVGEQPVKQNNTLRDVFSGALAVLGDAAAAQNGRPGFATKMLGEHWTGRNKAFDQALAAFEDRRRMALLPDMTERELAAYITNPQQWGSHMADAATSRYQAATLNPGDQRYLGDGNGAYQAPTRGQLYADSLDLQPGSQEWHDALRDQELGAQGPTGFSNTRALDAERHARAQGLERLRQQGRLELEGRRQSGRETLRGVPTYRDMNPPASAASGGPTPRRRPKRTATGPNGEKVEWNGTQWVPVR